MLRSIGTLVVVAACPWGLCRAAGPDPGGFEAVAVGKRVEIRLDGKPILTYVPDDGPKPYYYPLIGPSGLRMTRAFPMEKVAGEKTDHPHQRSMWFAHGSVNGVDFWSQLPGHGSIVATGRPSVEAGQDSATIRTTGDWLGPGGKKICEDAREVRVSLGRDARIIDFDLTLRATAGAVILGDTKEGLFGLRVPTSMDVGGGRGGKIVNAEGLADAKAWGQASAWVDYSGPVEGKIVGIAILNHPGSFRYPTTWHVRDYGLFAANPFGWKDFGKGESGQHVIPAGGSLRFRYRVILHDGDAAAARIPEAFEAYKALP